MNHLKLFENSNKELIENKEIEVENGENFKTADECLNAFKELHEGEFGGNGKQIFKIEKIEDGDLILSPSEYKIKKEAKKIQSMKHLKTFERFEVLHKQYWMIPTDERFEDAADKIGFVYPQEDNKSRFAWGDDEIGFRRIIQNHKFIFVSFYKTRINLLDIGKPQWDWTHNATTLEEDNYKFMGYVNMTQDEIEDYESRIEAKKYNL